MKWERPSRYYLESDAGYRVSITGQEAKRQYSAWAPRIAGVPQCLGVFRSRTEAEHRCEQHFAGEYPGEDDPTVPRGQP